MERDVIKQYADWLEQNSSDIIARRIAFDAQKLFDLVQQLGILDRPVNDYLTMSQDDYYRTVSDHKLTLQGEDEPMSHLQDRILINHVDGSLTENNLNFAYNHEDNFTGGYSARQDLNLITYGLEVVGAVVAISGSEFIKSHLSKDAVISLLLAAHSLNEWQAKN
ncbi:hypothetical protein FC15_GL000745 [Lapidilactobacillus concavus DSM 17758]|uniref:Uncharacterized protein n=1 Tax=Lapidilactobacillus concavus DSM 17758 TaxID=1423735 RepID=A0A0R1VR18_9LACO|nr:hypothetical protein [Lapidilactobacillus concavus]KRM08066.1 hypothetical protein FC15_GL000745 [Lapidilactobacillus concavus DSM 17758]GEL12946.1 hypothetical protein LCO01nite_04950 [Lapidilactobacillus concavus]